MIKRPFPYGGGGGSIEVEITADNQVSKELDKIKGDAEGLEKSGKGAGKSFDGLLATAKKLGAVVGIATLGKKVVDFGKSCVEAYSQFEQLEGGVQQLFGKSAPQVIKNASEAYKTAGMSMNQYLESATNFSAKLISDLGGNTDLATKYIDKAMAQMSDNANTFGTTLDEVQRAYQSMARGNYAMLDSLKLGYGGTKAEMERLLADAEKLSGQKYEMGNFADLIDAIQVVQDEFNITGKTALEASTTIEGSVNSMKSSWENLKVAIATGEDVEEKTRAFAESVGTVLENVVPVVERMLPELGHAIGTAIGEINIPEVVATVGNIAWELGEGVVEGLGEAIVGSLDGLGGWLNDHIRIDGVKIGDWFKFGHDPAQWESLATDMQSDIIQSLADNGGNWMDIPKEFREGLYDKLIDSFQRGDFDSVNKYLENMFSDTDTDVRMKINADGELEVTNTRELKLQALDEFKSALGDETLDTDAKIEAGVEFLMKAKEDGHTTEQLYDYIQNMEMPEDIKKELLIQLETKLDRGGDGGSFGGEVEQAKEELSKPETVDKTFTANADAEVNTSPAQAKLNNANNDIKNSWHNGNNNLGQKIFNGIAEAQITDNASKSITNAGTKIKSAWDNIKVSLGHKTVTGSVSATITTTITNIVKTIKKAVDTGKRAITGGIVEGLQSRTTFGSNAMMNYFVALSEGFDKIADRIQKTADKVSKASTKAIEESENALETQFVKLDEIVKKEEDLEKRQADLQLRQAKAKLGTGKTAEENESLQLAYERAEIAVYKLSDEYKNLEKAQKEEQDRLEKLKREQEDYNELVDDTTKSVDKLYDSYVKSLVNRNDMSDINLDESYNKQRNVVRAMEQLPTVLDSLRAKGMPDALIQKLLNLDPVEALKLAKKYDKMKESNFNSYVDLWSRQATAQTNLNVIDSQTNGKLEDLLEDLKEIAEDAPKELSDAILHGLTWKSGDWFGMGKDAVANLTLTWKTMTTNDLAKLLAPQIELEMGRKN